MISRLLKNSWEGKSGPDIWEEWAAAWDDEQGGGERGHPVLTKMFSSHGSPGRRLRLSGWGPVTLPAGYTSKHHRAQGHQGRGPDSHVRLEDPDDRLPIIFTIQQWPWPGPRSATWLPVRSTWGRSPGGASWWPWGPGWNWSGAAWAWGFFKLFKGLHWHKECKGIVRTPSMPIEIFPVIKRKPWK